MATELVKPTNTATKPAVAADKLKSFNQRMERSAAQELGGSAGSGRAAQISILLPNSTTALLGRLR